MTQGINASDDGAAVLAQASDTPLEQVAAEAIQVGDQTFHVGKVSLNQLIAIARLVISAATRMTSAERAELGDAVDEQKANLMSLLAVLDEETTASLFAAILKCKDQAWLAEHLGLAEVAEVVNALMDHNDWDRLRAAFFRLVRRFSKSGEAA